MITIWPLYNWPTTHLLFMSHYQVSTLHVFTTVQLIENLKKWPTIIYNYMNILGRM